MSCKPGGETHETTVSKHYQIPRFGANSDSHSSTGSFSKCGPWTMGSSFCAASITPNVPAHLLHRKCAGMRGTHAGATAKLGLMLCLLCFSSWKKGRNMTFAGTALAATNLTLKRSKHKAKQSSPILFSYSDHHASFTPRRGFADVLPLAAPVGRKGCFYQISRFEHPSN
jgi:hypothetical protein